MRDITDKARDFVAAFDESVRQRSLFPPAKASSSQEEPRMTTSLKDAAEDAARAVGSKIMGDAAAAVLTGKTRQLLSSVQIWAWLLAGGQAFFANVGITDEQTAAAGIVAVAVIGVVDRLKKGDLVIFAKK